MTIGTEIAVPISVPFRMLGQRLASPFATTVLSWLSRQYDFHKVRLTPSALRGLALEGQSRPVLEAHYERGGQP